MKKQLLLTLTGMSLIHLAFGQPIIQVRNSEDSLGVKKQIEQCLTHLDVGEKIHLLVRFSTDMPENLKGMTFCRNAPTPDAYQAIRVWIDARLNKTQRSIVLAHEIIHVKQYAKGELIMIDEGEVMWKGQKDWYQTADNHYTPWEHEAYRNDNRLAKLLKEHPELPLTALRTNP